MNLIHIFLCKIYKTKGNDDLSKRIVEEAICFTNADIPL